MEKKKRKSLKTSFVVVVIAVFVILVGYGRYMEAQDKFVYQEHLEEVIFAVDEYDMTLREFGFYVYEIETYVQEQALIYNPKNPLDYWNTHFSAGDDSNFMFNYALNTAINNAVCDLVYENIAKKEGYSLTEEEKKDAVSSAKDCYEKMSEVQQRSTGLTQDDVEKVALRKMLTKKYALDFVKKVDLTGYSGNLEEEISGGGDFFKEKILVEHNVEYNDSLREKIVLGQITVNK